MPEPDRLPDDSLAAYGAPKVTAQEHEPAHPLIHYRTFALAGFAVASLLEGVLQRRSEFAGVPAILAEASAATMWCVVDASMRGIYFVHSLRWITMLTWPIAVPVYLWRTRRWRGMAFVGAGLLLVISTQALGGWLNDLLHTP